MMDVIIYIDLGMRFWVILPLLGVTGVTLGAGEIEGHMVVLGFAGFPTNIDVIATGFTGTSAVHVHRNKVRAPLTCAAKGVRTCREHGGVVSIMVLAIR